MQEATADAEEPILNGAGREEVRRGRVLAQILYKCCVYIYRLVVIVAYSTNSVGHRKTVTTCMASRFHICLIFFFFNC